MERVERVQRLTKLSELVRQALAINAAKRTTLEDLQRTVDRDLRYAQDELSQSELDELTTRLIAGT